MYKYGFLLSLAFLTACSSIPAPRSSTAADEQIIFTRSGPLTSSAVPLDLWIINADGSGLRRLTAAVNNYSDNALAAWSADGHRITFIGYRSENNPNKIGDLYMATVSTAPDGTPVLQDITNRTNTPAVDELESAWSPDCLSVVFTGVVLTSDPSTQRSHLFLLDVASNTVTPLTDGQDEETMPSWSPDGRHIAFTRSYNDHRSIWLIDLNSKGLTQLTTNDFFDDGPTWNPSGTRVAFSRWNTGESRRIMEMDPVDADNDGQGDHLIQLTHPPAGFADDGASYSPAGDKLAFSRTTCAPGTSGDNCANVGDIFILNIQSGTEISLTNSATSDYETAPAWRPRGTCK